MKVILLLSICVTLTYGQDTPVFRSDAVRARALRPPSRSGERFAPPQQQLQPRPAPRFPQFTQQQQFQPQQFQSQPRLPPPSFPQQQSEPPLPTFQQQQRPQPIETRFQPRPQAPPQPPPQRFLPRPQPPAQQPQPIQFQRRPQPAPAPAPRPAPVPAPRPQLPSRAATSTTTAPPVAILKQISQHNDDGSYTYGYQGADGSFKLETKSADGTVKGKYGYVDANGEQVVIEYGADKFGFQPSGDGINVPPPNDPSDDKQYDEQGFLIVKEDSEDTTRSVARPLPRPRPSPSTPVVQPQPQRRIRPVQPSASRPAPIDVQRQLASRPAPPPRQDFTQAVPVGSFGPAQPQAPRNVFSQAPQSNFIEEQKPSLPPNPFSFSVNTNFGGDTRAFNPSPVSRSSQPQQNVRGQFESSGSFKNLFDGFFE